MHPILTLIICVLFSFFTYSVNAQSILIKDVSIVASEAPLLLPAQSVLIENGQISQITPSTIDGIEVDTIVDGKGLFLTAGFIDSHVHLFSDGGVITQDQDQQQSLVNQFQRREPLNYLAHGFTTVLDLSSSERSVARWKRYPVKPNLEYCLSAPFTNGYGMAFEDESTRFNTPHFLYDPEQADKVPEHINPLEHTVSAVVQKIAKTNARCIKVYFETGFAGLFNFPTPSTDLISELVKKAHEKKLVVILHGNSLESWKFALTTNVDVIAHGLWHWDEFNNQREISGPVQQVLDAVIKQGIFIQPTTRVLHGEYELLREPLPESSLRSVLPQDLIDYYHTEEGRWFKRRMTGLNMNNPDIVAAFIGDHSISDFKPGDATKAGIQRLEATVDYLSNNNGNLLFGSDTPSSPTFTNVPGLNSSLEIYHWYEAGVSLQQILHSLTIANARAFNFADVTGSVEVGKRADLVLMKANPLETISAYKQIESIIVNGQLYPRALLLEKPEN